MTPLRCGIKPEELSVSAIICTHNPRKEYLERTVAGMRAQGLARERWELLLIDNASHDPVSGRCDLSWHPRGRVVREEQLGLTPARLRGIREAGGELLLFVDDDNILAPDFLERALDVAQRYPFLGAFGAGVLEPEFEVPPEKAIEPLLPRLALRTVSTPLWTNNHQDGAASPYGAGMCVTRTVAACYHEIVEQLSRHVMLDRRGQNLSSNGDDLFSWAAVQCGQGFGVFPELRIRHLIPAGRLTREYMLRLVRDSRFSECVLYFILLGIAPRPMGLGLISRVILEGLRHGAFAMRCRLAAAVGEARAARFISDQNIHPLGAGAFGTASGGKMAEGLPPARLVGSAS